MGVEQRLAALEQRVRELEDDRAVRQVLAAYGPRVDAGDADGTAALWEADGVYDVDELVMHGQGEIADMVRSAGHQGFVERGCAHVIGPPHVTVTGDDAVAVGHSLMVVQREGRFVVRRAAANRWELRRGPDGWRVVSRTTRVLDGRTEAPALLGQA